MDIKAINSAIVTGTWTAMELDAISDAVKFARSRVAQTLSFSLQSGAKVKLTHAKLGGTVQGTVLKVKIKKADVRLDSGVTYTVPLSMLTPA